MLINVSAAQVLQRKERCHEILKPVTRNDLAIL